MDKLVFQNHPDVHIATNIFIGVPIVLQYEDTPLLEVVRSADAGFTTRVPIYGADGTYLANVVGSQLYLTDVGKKSGLKLTHPDGMTVCELGGQTLFEIRREDAAALRTTAELFTPDGYLLKFSSGDGSGLFSIDGDDLVGPGFTRFRGCTFQNMRIGMLAKSDGTLIIGSS